MAGPRKPPHRSAVKTTTRSISQRIIGLQNNRHCPLRLVPDEILSEILIHAWNLCPINYHRFHFPHGAVLVCKHWREVTLNTAALWSYIQLTEIEKPNFPKIITRLARTKGGFIDLYISGSRSRHDDGMLQDTLQQLLLLLLPHKLRLWAVDLSLPPTLLPLAFNLLLGHPENYRSSNSTPKSDTTPDVTYPSAIRILRFWGEYDPKDSPSLPLVYLPSLQTFICNASPPNFIFGSPLLQGNNHGRLVKLSVGSSIWDNDSLPLFKSTLEQNPGLEILLLESIRVDAKNSLQGTPAHLPCLSFLRLSDIRTFGLRLAECVFAAFEAPNLKDLAMDDMKGVWILEPYYTVKRVWYGAMAADWTIAMCPTSVTHFTMASWDEEDMATLLEFIDSGATAPKFPHLHTLIVDWVDLPLVVRALRALSSTVRTVQINADDMCWVDEKPSEDEWGRKKKRYTLKQHQKNIEWLKQNFHVEIWGRSFAEAYSKLSVSDKKKKTWEAAITSSCEGLRWVDSKDVWRGDVPLGPHEWAEV